MQALTVEPGVPGSLRLEERPEPPAGEGSVLVRGLALGVCGTDAEIVRGEFGSAPPGAPRLVLGHESLGRVLEAPPGSGLAVGDLVVGIVRRPDPVPCACCAIGRWDACRNGRYTERGIKQLDGYGAQRWRVEPEFCLRLDPSFERTGVLLEPASVVAKAWDEIDGHVRRGCAPPRVALVTGAGPIGLLAALLAVQRGLEVHVLDLVDDGPKPRLAAELGVTYHTGAVGDLGVEPDVVVEATGVGQVVIDVISVTAPGAVVCLTGVSSGGRSIPVDIGAIGTRLVLENHVVFGSVNASRRHYVLAADALAAADPAWLEGLITRRVPLDRFAEAFARRPGDVKVVIELG
jgi:threonine dehydrogenase-like Zn-dependent dehydrogenase